VPLKCSLALAAAMAASVSAAACAAAATAVALVLQAADMRDPLVESFHCHHCAAEAWLLVPLLLLLPCVA
jgi:hypothetical protein